LMLLILLTLLLMYQRLVSRSINAITSTKQNSRPATIPARAWLCHPIITLGECLAEEPPQFQTELVLEDDLEKGIVCRRPRYCRSLLVHQHQPRWRVPESWFLRMVPVRVRPCIICVTSTVCAPRIKVDGRRVCLWIALVSERVVRVVESRAVTFGTATSDSSSGNDDHELWQQ
jgi:hypothetical protein